MKPPRELRWFLTDRDVLIGQEEHRLHAGAALSVRPDGRFYP